MNAITYNPQENGTVIYAVTPNAPAGRYVLETPLTKAASELLGALQTVERTLPHFVGNERSVHGLLQIVSAAIAKATA